MAILQSLGVFCRRSHKMEANSPWREAGKAGEDGNCELKWPKERDAMRAFVEEALYRCFGMRVKAMWEVPGGWSAHALVADTDAGQYFVKVYDKHRPTVQSWIARMRENMPVVLWLRDN